MGTKFWIKLVLSLLTVALGHLDEASGPRNPAWGPRLSSTLLR